MSYIFDEINKQDSEIGKMLFYSSYMLLIIAIITTMYYISEFSKDIRRMKFYSSPLNIQSYKYKSMNIFDVNNTGYFNMLHISITHGLSFLLALIALAYFNNVPFSAYFGLLIGFIIVLFHILMRFLNKSYINSKSRINSLNNEICSLIYKRLDFLKTLRDSSTVSVFDIKDTIVKSLETIDPSTSEKDLIKVFFTLTMFNHFAKIHHSNSEIDRDELFKLFDHSTLLCKSCRPVDYLHVSGTRIEQIVDTYIEGNLGFKTASSINAIKECAIIVERINEYANNLNLDESYNNVFLVTVLLLIILQMVAIIIIHQKDIISTVSAPRDIISNIAGIFVILFLIVHTIFIILLSGV